MSTWSSPAAASPLTPHAAHPRSDAWPAFPVFPAHDDSVRRWAALAPTHTALVDADGDDRGDARWSYAALDARADRWARLLVARGAGPGTRVALLAGTRAECVALFFGCLRAGAALVPLNWRLAAAELARVLADARPALFVVESRWQALAGAALAHPVAAPLVEALPDIVGLDVLREADAERDAPRPLPPLPPLPPATGEEPTMLLYTSGSTGAPKGVVLPRRQLLYNAVATQVGWQLGPQEVVPVATPLFHTGGWHVLTTPVLHAGGTVVLLDGFEPGRFLDALAEHRCTVAFAVPTQFTMLLEDARWGRPLPALRRFVSGGAPCPPAVRHAVQASGIGFREGYGLTECGPNCFATSDAIAAAYPGSVGVPAPFLEARLVDADGRDVRPGATGELLLRGPQLFAGYHDAPDRTAEALTPDGWLRTGDLAERDARGVYRICGRRKEMFISGGENVFPGEVEAALAECAGVAESAVVGVPDARWGEVGCAFVVPRPGASLDAATFAAEARTRLAGYKVPRRVVFVDVLPRLGSGKVDRRALLDRAAGSEGP